MDQSLKNYIAFGDSADSFYKKYEEARKRGQYTLAEQYKSMAKDMIAMQMFAEEDLR